MPTSGATPHRIHVGAGHSHQTLATHVGGLEFGEAALVSLELGVAGVSVEMVGVERVADAPFHAPETVVARLLEAQLVVRSPIGVQGSPPIGFIRTPKLGRPTLVAATKNQAVSTTWENAEDSDCKTERWQGVQG